MASSGVECYGLPKRPATGLHIRGLFVQLTLIRRFVLAAGLALIATGAPA